MNTRSKAVVIFLCFLVAALEGYDLQAIGVAMPMLAPLLDLTKADIGFILSGTMLGLMFGAISGGWLGDTIGRRKTLFVSVVIFGLATIATVLVYDVLTLTLVRIATGVGIGSAMPNIMAISTDISRKENRAFTGMLMFCGFPVGAIGVALLAQTSPDLDWRTIFYVGGVLPVLLAPLFFLMPETSPISVGIHDEQPGRLSSLFGQGRLPLTLCMWIAFSLTLVILYLMLNWLPTLIVEKGFSKIEGAGAALYFNLGSVAGALLLGLLVDRFGLRWPMLVTYIVLFTGLYFLSQASSLHQVFLLAGLCGACCVGSQFALYGAAPAYYPEHTRSLGAGAAIAAGRTGAIAGPLAAGLLMQGGMSGDQVVLAMAPVVAFGGLSVFAISFFRAFDDPGTLTH